MVFIFLGLTNLLSVVICLYTIAERLAWEPFQDIFDESNTFPIVEVE